MMGLYCGVIFYRQSLRILLPFRIKFYKLSPVYLREVSAFLYYLPPTIDLSASSVLYLTRSRVALFANYLLRSLGKGLNLDVVAILLTLPLI
jgi:hypothetical protein